MVIIDQMENKFTIQPYRATPKKYGKIEGAIAIAIHNCQLWKPNIWNWLGIKKPQFQQGDLFRCDCGEVYIFWAWSYRAKIPQIIDHCSLLNCEHNCSHNICSFWCRTSINVWTNYSGIE